MNLLLILPPAENIGNVYDRTLRERFPQLQIHSVHRHDQAPPHLPSTEVIISFSPFMADHVVRDAPRLKWIQVLGSGVDGVVNLPSLRQDILITNGHGVQATPVSEAAIALMFALSREFPRMVQNQLARRWERWPSELLHGRTVGILGVGQISEALAVKCKALGMRVVGVSSATRAVPGFDQMYSRERLVEAVREFDFFVLLTPYSEATHHIVNATVLAAMKPSAYLINVARGGVVNEADLAHALKHKIIRAAALDVFQQEPLPAESELWSLPNLLISPHLAGLNTSYPQHIMPLLEKNIALFLEGRYREMTNVVRAAEPARTQVR